MKNTSVPMTDHISSCNHIWLYVTILTGQVLIKEHPSSKFSLQKTETIPQKTL